MTLAWRVISQTIAIDKQSVAESVTPKSGPKKYEKIIVLFVQSGVGFGGFRRALRFTAY